MVPPQEGFSTTATYSAFSREKDKRYPCLVVRPNSSAEFVNLVGLTEPIRHPDLWWTPAEKDQTTDRVHRIGQNKPVFVYKLIAAGTVEERMLELQSRKRSMAAALFNPESTGLQHREGGAGPHLLISSARPQPSQA